MGAVIPIAPKQVGRSLIKRNEATFRAIAQGALRAAHRGRALLVRESPKDQGQFKASWKVRAGSAAKSGKRSMFRTFKGLVGGGVRLADVINDAPHAGIIEKGARPHRVSEEGIQALTDWVWRNLRDQLGVVEGPVKRGSGGRTKLVRDAKMRQARGIAEAIAWKLRTKGQDPQYIVRGNLALLWGMAEEEIHRRIDALSRRKSV